MVKNYHQNRTENKDYQMNKGGVDGVVKCVISSFSVAMPRKYNQLHNSVYYVHISHRRAINRVIKKALLTAKRISASISSNGPRGSAIERQSLASVLSPSCARPVADG